MIVRADADQRLHAVTYLANRFGLRPDAIVTDDRFDVFLACKDNDARGVVLFKNYASGDIEMVVAGEPGWITKEVVRFALSYPFLALGCERITSIAHRKNKVSRQYLERLGFKLEGIKRKGIHGGDAMIYGLLREESKWV